MKQTLSDESDFRRRKYPRGAEGARNRDQATATRHLYATPPPAKRYPRAMVAPFWYVYVLVSSTMKRTYVGVTLDVARRLSQHNGAERRGARTTRAGRPWRIGAVYGPYSCRGEAQRIERHVKRLSGARRLELLAHLGRSSQDGPSAAGPLGATRRGARPTPPC
jgi:predicted GIY-YIG superfamily endonuclease